jgi:hypothetical protein
VGDAGEGRPLDRGTLLGAFEGDDGALAPGGAARQGRDDPEGLPRRQDKLDSDTLKEQAKTRTKDTVRTTGSQAAETVKQNPAIPLAGGGGMLALLLLRRLLGGGGSEGVVVDLKKRRTRGGWPRKASFQ